MIGAEMVVMTRRTDAARSRNVPTWWKIPVLAILRFVFACGDGVDGGMEEERRGEGAVER